MCSLASLLRMRFNKLFQRKLLQAFSLIHKYIIKLVQKGVDDNGWDKKNTEVTLLLRFSRRRPILTRRERPARRYASAVLTAIVCLSVCPFVRLSQVAVQLRRLNLYRITQISPYDSPGNLVLWCQKSRRNSNGVTTVESTNRGMVC